MAELLPAGRHYAVGTLLKSSRGVLCSGAKVDGFVLESTS
jgi:hypothetical protein